MNRSNVLISWIIRGENGTISSLSHSFSRPIHLWWVSEAVFSLDRILIAIRRARFDIRWRGLSIEAATFHWIGSMLIVKSITIFLWTLLISGRGRERRVLLSSVLFPSLPSLSFSFLQHWPRKIKLRMLVTGVRRRNAWTIRDRTQNSTRYSPVRWKSWQRVVIPIPFPVPPPLPVLVISKCDADENDAWQREKRNWKISSSFGDVWWYFKLVIPSFLLIPAWNWPLLICQVTCIEKKKKKKTLVYVWKCRKEIW